MSPVVHSPLSSMFHLIKNQNKLLTLFCHTFTASISTETQKHCYFLKSLKLEMKHFYVDMESRTTIGNRRVCSGISYPRRGLILLITRRPEFISYFWYPCGVNLDFLKTFWKVDVDPLASFSQLEILKWLLGFEHFLIQEPGVFVYRLDSI